MKIYRPQVTPGGPPKYVPIHLRHSENGFVRERTEKATAITKKRNFHQI